MIRFKMEPEYIIGIFLGMVLFISLVATIVFTYMDEKKKCKHKWEETERFRGINVLGTYTTEVHLRCINCGDVKKVYL